MTAALTALDRLDHDLEDLDPSEFDADDLADDGEDDAPPLRRYGIDRTRQQQLRRTISAAHVATRTGLLDLVSQALAAKVAHDVDAHPLAVDALDAFTATATALRTAIATEQQTTRGAEDNDQ